MNGVTKISTVILAGGKSERMNEPKPFLYFDNEKTFLQKIVEIYINAGIKNVIVVINSAIEEKAREVLSKLIQTKQVKLILNQYPERGRFYSIQQGIKNAGGDFCFLQNIDNPFTSTDLLEQMMNAANQNSYVMPNYHEKDGHPVFISNNIVMHLLSLKGDKHNLREELNNFERVKLPWQNENILVNINTEDDYRIYFLQCKAFTKN